MTDEYNDKPTTDNQPDDEILPVAQETVDDSPHDESPREDDFDVEAALAAVASLEHLATPAQLDHDASDDDADFADFDDSETDEGDYAAQDAYEPLFGDPFAADDELFAFADDIETAEPTRPADDEDDFAGTMPFPDSPPDDDFGVSPDDANALDDRFEQVDTPQIALSRPPISELNRGTLASVIPALLLIGLGGTLTFLLTTTQLIISPLMVAMFAIGAIGIVLLVQWLASARWAIGSFFIGIMLLLVAITGAYLVQPTNLSLAQGYPLFLTAIGLAFILTDIFTASRNRVWFIGLLIGIAGVVGVLFTSEMLDGVILTTIQRYWYIPLIVIVLILIAPLLNRTQEQPTDE